MSEIPVDIDHVKHSVGGAGGHWFRRGTHISMCIIPFAFHLWGEEIAGIVNLTPREFVISVLVFFVVLEAIRVKFGIVIVGQREYEAQQISALGWGAFAVCLALIIAPQEGDGLEAGKFTIPLICGLTFVDPIMGGSKTSQERYASSNNRRTCSFLYRVDGICSSIFHTLPCCRYSLTPDRSGRGSSG